MVRPLLVNKHLDHSSTYQSECPASLALAGDLEAYKAYYKPLMVYCVVTSASCGDYAKDQRDKMTYRAITKAHQQVKLF